MSMTSAFLEGNMFIKFIKLGDCYELIKNKYCLRLKMKGEKEKKGRKKK